MMSFARCLMLVFPLLFCFASVCGVLERSRGLVCCKANLTLLAVMCVFGERSLPSLAWSSLAANATTLTDLTTVAVGHEGRP